MNDFISNEEFLKLVEQTKVKEYTIIMDDEGHRSFVSQDDDPHHGELLDRQQLLELLKNNQDFKGKYKSGYYSYKNGHLYVKNRIHTEGKDLRFLAGMSGHPLLSAEELKDIKRDLVAYQSKKSFEDFYEAADYFMKDRKVTQLMMAQEMNVSAAYISRILNKKETLTINLIVCFSLILKLSPYYSKKLLSLAGFSIEDNPKYSLYLLLLNEHYNASLEYCDAIIDALSDDEERGEYRLIRRRND